MPDYSKMPTKALLAELKHTPRHPNGKLREHTREMVAEIQRRKARKNVEPASVKKLVRYLDGRKSLEKAAATNLPGD